MKSATTSALFEIKECKTKAVFEAKPIKNIRLDLNRLKARYQTSFTSPIAIVLNIKGHEIVVHKHGLIMFKDLRDQKKMQKIAQEMYNESLL